MGKRGRTAMKVVFNEQKILSFLHLLQDGKQERTYTYLIKLLFLAERWHLRHYGIMMTGDVPIGINHGSLLLNSLNLLKTNTINLIEVSINNSIFSKSEKKAIEFALGTFSKIGEYDLGCITKSYPEWYNLRHCLITSHHFIEDSTLLFDNPNPKSENYKYIEQFFNGKDPFTDDREFLNALKEEYILS